MSSPIDEIFQQIFGYANINGTLTEMCGLEYEFGYSYHTQKIEITDNSEFRFALLDQDDNIIKFLSDEKLREYSFDDDGKVRKNNKIMEYKWI